ncbi:MAG: hypothetical protein IRZ00_07930 [Gemmatimonadetes bacterium]|nr:hypothetical protein [Gemmatimonadota bacterium]
MPGTDKREAAYAQARTELMTELLRAGAFDMDEHHRGESVARIVRDLSRKYPELDEQMARRLVGEGMQRTYGEAATSESARKGREAP